MADKDWGLRWGTKATDQDQQDKKPGTRNLTAPTFPALPSPFGHEFLNLVGFNRNIRH